MLSGALVAAVLVGVFVWGVERVVGELRGLRRLLASVEDSGVVDEVAVVRGAVDDVRLVLADFREAVVDLGVRSAAAQLAESVALREALERMRPQLQPLPVPSSAPVTRPMSADEKVVTWGELRRLGAERRRQEAMRAEAQAKVAEFEESRRVEREDRRVEEVRPVFIDEVEPVPMESWDGVTRRTTPMDDIFKRAREGEQ
jgi:hypothetical protein